jgi:hypothetical protein
MNGTCVIEEEWLASVAKAPKHVCPKGASIAPAKGAALVEMAEKHKLPGQRPNRFSREMIGPLGRERIIKT